MTGVLLKFVWFVFFFFPGRLSHHLRTLGGKKEMRFILTKLLLSSSCEKQIIDEVTSNSAAIKVLWRVWIHLIWCLACMNNETPTKPSISSFLSETSSPGNSLLPDSERYFSMDGKRMWPSPCGAPPRATYASVLYISPPPVEKGKEKKKNRWANHGKGSCYWPGTCSLKTVGKRLFKNPISIRLRIFSQFLFILSVVDIRREFIQLTAKNTCCWQHVKVYISRKRTLEEQK